MKVKISPIIFNVAYKRLSGAVQSIVIFHYQRWQTECIEKGCSYEKHLQNSVKE